MQDRTIDNSLLALAKQGGQQGKLAQGPHTNIQLGKIMQASRREITPNAAANMTYQALLRLTYAQLSELLAGIGVDGNEKNIANKISRGVFTLAFFFAMYGRYRGWRGSSLVWRTYAERHRAF